MAFRDAVGHRVADTEAALTRLAGKKTDDDGDLATVESLQEPGENRHLGGARARLADLSGCRDYRGEQRQRSVLRASGSGGTRI